MIETADMDVLIWYWFVNIPSIGQITRNRLLKTFFHPKEVYKAEINRLETILTPQQQKNLLASKDLLRYQNSFLNLHKKGIRFVHWESKDYPQRFRRLYDPPFGFYLIGSLPDETKPALAMVGSRRATSYGRRIGEDYAGIFARAGIQIISGMAAGADAACHRGALKADGFTLGILGGGIDTLYPRENYGLYRQMYEKGGIMSEYHPGIKNHRGLFPERNRLISAISDAVFVLEAGKRSGSLITADQSLEQGKDVFALPGRITDPMSEGCNELIAQGAVPVLSAKDILAFFHLENKDSQKAGPIIPDPDQRNVYNLLDMIEPKAFDEIMKESGLREKELFHILFQMELQGIVIQKSQNQYVKGL